MAKIDESGQIVTSPNLLKTLYLKTYTNRLKHRIMKPDYNDVFFSQNGTMDVKT